MKLRQHTGEPKPRRARARDVVGRESGPEDFHIPWERMTERYKPEFIEFFDQADNSDELSTVHAILLLFPELRPRLHFSDEDFENFCTFYEDEDYTYLPEVFEIFPKKRKELKKVLKKAIQKAESNLKEAKEKEPPDYLTIFTVLSYVPQFFPQYEQVLKQGQDVLLEDIQKEDRQYDTLAKMADLVLLFPELRPKIQEILAHRRSEVLNGFAEWIKDPGLDDQPDTHSLAWGLSRLKIIYAESAGHTPEGTIYIQDRKRLGHLQAALPERELAS